MAVPTWPAGVRYAPDLSSMSGIKRFRDPIKTDMEGGNTRLRARPGDNVGSMAQTIVMPRADFNTFTEWVKTTLNNGTGRFSVDVWLGNGFETKVCQFDGGPTYQPRGTQRVAVTMNLRVYGV